MSREKFEEECKGCRPALIDTKTMKPLQEDHPDMQLMNSVFETLTREQKEAFHNVTCLNSRKPEDLKVIEVIQQRISAVLVPGN